MPAGPAPGKRHLQGEGKQLDALGIRPKKKSKQAEMALSAEIAKTAGSKAMAKPRFSEFRKGFREYLDAGSVREEGHEVNPGLVLTSAPRERRSDDRWHDMDDDSTELVAWADGSDVENRDADNAHPVCNTAASKDDPSRDNMIIGLTNHGGAAKEHSTRGARRMEHILGNVDMVQGLLEMNEIDHRQITTFDPKSRYQTGGVWTGTALHIDMCVVGLKPFVAEVKTLKAGTYKGWMRHCTRWLIAEVCFKHTVCGMKTLRVAWPANDA